MVKEAIINRINFDMMLIEAYSAYPHEPICASRLKDLKQEVENLRAQLKEEKKYY